MKHFEVNPEHATNPPEDCYGCKIARVTFGSVPGGTRPGSIGKAKTAQFEKDMNAYSAARKAGEQPHQVSEKSVKANRLRQESLERARKKIVQWED